MKRLVIFCSIIFIFFSQKSKAQNCADIIHQNGYYVVMRNAPQAEPQRQWNDTVSVIHLPIDSRSFNSFIPCDSISTRYPLSYWLNHFFDDTKQVFVSCEDVGIEYFLSNECSVQLKSDTCTFPKLKANALYQTTNRNVGVVFEIYYIDAYWAKIKIKKGTIQETMIPSRIAETSIRADVSEFDLYYFIRYDKMSESPIIKDPSIKVWKQL